MAQNQTTFAVENWKPVVGYEGLYEVSDNGGVFALERERVGVIANGQAVSKLWPAHRLRCTPAHNGYPAVTLSKNGKVTKRTVHSLVLEAFVGPRPKGMECCHGNGIKTDNHVTNLRWDTPKANAADSARHGTKIRGETAGRHRLSEEQVREIRRTYRRRSHPNTADLARKFGVASHTISLIIRRVNWAWFE